MSALRPSFLLLAAAVVSVGGPLDAGSDPRALNAHDRSVVQRVTARAAARLEDTECGKVLTDFQDRNGRTLESNLRPFGLSASQYLQQIAFLDGSQLPTCYALTVVMATTPGKPRVFVCPAGPGRLNSRLSRIELESRPLAEAMVIHEMLHTLGLSENPPTTFEITERVRQRCR